MIKGDIAVPTALRGAVYRISQRDLIRELVHGQSNKTRLSAAYRIVIVDGIYHIIAARIELSVRINDLLLHVGGEYVAQGISIAADKARDDLILSVVPARYLFFIGIIGIIYDVEVDHSLRVDDHLKLLGRNGKLNGGVLCEHIVAHILAARYLGGGGIAAAVRVGVRLRAAHGDLQIVACNKPLRLAHVCGRHLRQAVIGERGIFPRNAHGFARNGKLNGGVLCEHIVAHILAARYLGGGGVIVARVRLLASHSDL